MGFVYHAPVRHVLPISLSFFAVLAALAVSASCGSKPACGITTCPGCCDSHGACQAGSSTTACGENGVLCQACGALSSCTLGTCVPLSGSGGGLGGGSGGGGGGGTVCSPTNCTGCCANNTCFPGTTASECGAHGNFCQTCGTGQSCSQSACVNTGTGGGSAQCNPANCAGCCSGSFCMAGNLNDSCGTNGASCESCQSIGQVCVSGGCTFGGSGGGGGGSLCNSGTCAGCCAGNTCIPTSAQTAVNCGQFGQLCLSCPNPQACVSGACSGGTGGGAGGDGGCAAISLAGTITEAFYSAPPNEVTFTFKHAATATYNESTYELWWVPTAPTLPYTENFSTASKYNTCEACVTYRETCTATAACSGRFFFAQTGSISVNTATRADAGVMQGSATAMTLQEWDTTNDVPVSGGACVTLPATTFNVSF
jgi:hypothetical protein